MRYIWLLRFQSPYQVIQYISEISDFQQPCILKTAGRRAKRTQIWALGGKYLLYTGYFLQLSVQS